MVTYSRCRMMTCTVPVATGSYASTGSTTLSIMLLPARFSIYNYSFFFSSRRRHTRLQGDWSSDVCSSDLSGRTPEGRSMKSASELLEAYLNNVATPKVSASQFAEDGVLELPWVKAYARGPAEAEKLLVGLLPKGPDFPCHNRTYFLQTPAKVAAE